MKMMGILIMGLLKGTYVNIPFLLRKDYYYSQQNNNIYFIYYFLCHCIDYSEDGKVVGVLIANKTDLDDRRRRVSPKVGHELATQLGLVYFECSAKDFQGMFFSLLMNDIQKIVLFQYSWKNQYKCHTQESFIFRSGKSILLPRKRMA